MSLAGVALLALTGAFTGLLSGLFGVGGGLVIVPALLVLLAHQGFPPAHLMHVALGSSLAIIVFTSVASARAHHRHGNVDWPMACRLAPGVMLGTLGGAWLAAQLDSASLKLMFIGFVYYVGTHFLFDLGTPGKHPWPRWLLLPASAVIGVASSLLGIGGGTLTVPLLVHLRHEMRRAVGTSAAVGFPIAVAGTVGYVATGLPIAGMPAGSLGFVYLPAVAGITVASMLTAPVGARLASRLPARTLKRLFGLLLYALGARMLWGLL